MCRGLVAARFQVGHKLHIKLPNIKAGDVFAVPGRSHPRGKCRACRSVGAWSAGCRRQRNLCRPGHRFRRQSSGQSGGSDLTGNARRRLSSVQSQRIGKTPLPVPEAAHCAPHTAYRSNPMPRPENPGRYRPAVQRQNCTSGQCAVAASAVPARTGNRQICSRGAAC